MHSEKGRGPRLVVANPNGGAASAHVDSARRMLRPPKSSGALIAARCNTSAGSVYDQLENVTDIKLKTFLETLALEDLGSRVVIAAHLLEPLALAVTSVAPDAAQGSPLARLVDVIAEVGDVARALPEGASRAELFTQIAEARAALDALAAAVHREAR